MEKTFINFSNLHTNKWREDMLEAAKQLSPNGEIVNMAFPQVPPDYTKEQVDKMAKEYTRKLIEKNPEVVYCQGDLSLCFEIVAELKAIGVKAVTSCNERIISSQDGKTISGFRFVQFREF